MGFNSAFKGLIVVLEEGADTYPTAAAKQSSQKAQDVRTSTTVFTVTTFTAASL